jgi:hypothetical protein
MPDEMAGANTVMCKAVPGDMKAASGDTQSSTT